MGVSWGYLGDIFGISLGYFWDIFGIFLGYFGEIFKISLGSLRYIWDILGILWGHLGDILRISLSERTSGVPPVIFFILVRSCLRITLIKCLKGHKSLESLFKGAL